MSPFDEIESNVRYYCRRWPAVFSTARGSTIVDEDGRIDASELEVALLSDPSALITDMTPEEERALEDATEEIWDQHTSPEFKWDD